MNQKESIFLVSTIFNSEDGKKLIKVLEAELSNSLFDTEPTKMAYRIGQLDLIRNLKFTAENCDKLLETLKAQEKSQSNFNSTGEAI